MGSKQDRILRAAAAADNLPSLPTPVLRVVRMAGDPAVSVTQLARAAEADATLAGRMLRTANSSYYGLPRRVSTIYEATALLGSKTVRNLAMFAVACSWFSTKEAATRSWMSELLTKAIAVGVASQLIAERYLTEMSEEAFAAGLLHDVGASAMLVWRGQAYGRIIALAERSLRPVHEVESQAYGFDHADLGARVADDWALPAVLVNAIRGHNDPWEDKEQAAVTKIVYLAEHLVKEASLEVSWDPHWRADSDRACADLGIAPHSLPELGETVETRYQQIFSIALAA